MARQFYGGGSRGVRNGTSYPSLVRRTLIRQLWRLRRGCDSSTVTIPICLGRGGCAGREGYGWSRSGFRYPRWFHVHRSGGYGTAGVHGFRRRILGQTFPVGQVRGVRRRICPRALKICFRVGFGRRVVGTVDARPDGGWRLSIWLECCLESLGPRTRRMRLPGGDCRLLLTKGIF